MSEDLTLTKYAKWEEFFSKELKAAYMQDLKAFLRSEKDLKKNIYPHSSQVFKAMDLCPLDKTKVVILGQDPYHGPNQAMGLSFSVPKDVPLPPSLKNIYKELHSDLNIAPSTSGDLQAWAKQGVLLLNSVLTVEQGRPASHQGQGWEAFTDQIIAQLNAVERPIVFLLWGAYAQRKGLIIDNPHHLILKSAHPSPFSVHKGFYGCQHFSKANAFLSKSGQSPINWALDD